VSQVTGGVVHFCVDGLKPTSSDLTCTTGCKYPRLRINELATNSKNRNIGDLYRGISEFRGGGVTTL
jgi:hypothetical protein